jgi:hypothetical protein
LLTPHDFDLDIVPYEADAISSAYALVLKLLPDLGSKGEECGHKLTQAAQRLQDEGGRITGLRDAFRAFHLGYVTKQQAGLDNDLVQTVWSGNSGLNDAFIVGQQAARLNYLFEKPASFFRRAKIGPFSTSDVHSIFSRAMSAVDTSGKRMAANR